MTVFLQRVSIGRQSVAVFERNGTCNDSRLSGTGTTECCGRLQLLCDIIIIIIVFSSFMQGIYTYIPETNHVTREHIVAAILSLLFMVPISPVPALALLYFYISTFRSMILLLLLLLLLNNFLLSLRRKCLISPIVTVTVFNVLATLLQVILVFLCRSFPLHRLRNLIYTFCHFKLMINHR
jgi:hypothetical protein